MQRLLPTQCSRGAGVDPAIIRWNPLMKTQVLVDGSDFWDSLKTDIAAARKYVFVQALSFEGDRVGKDLSQSMVETGATDRRIIVDEVFTAHYINDKFLYHPKHWFNLQIRRERNDTLEMIKDLQTNGVRVKRANPAGPWLLNTIARNHKKLIVIDDALAYIGGQNFSEHNFSWHDMMLRIEDEGVARFLKSDFLSTWAGHNSNAAASFENMDFHPVDGLTNAQTFAPLLDLIGAARDSVFVESPYISFPFFEALRRAQRNGARITVVLPDVSNRRSHRKYALWECRRSGFEVRMYPGRMNHLKAMLVDGRSLIVGSSNFDFLSFHFLQEIVAVIRDPAVISEFRDNVLDPDLKLSEPPVETVGGMTGHYHQLRFKTVSWFFNNVVRVPTYGQQRP